jgi:hypothetical protein
LQFYRILFSSGTRLNIKLPARKQRGMASAEARANLIQGCIARSLNAMQTLDQDRRVEE